MVPSYLIVFLSIMPVLAILAALSDLTTMKIPNWISVALFLSFYPVAYLVGLAPMDMLLATGIGLGVLLIGMVMFALRWMGGGDAKLLATVALWMGIQGVTPFVLLTAIAGGGLCISLMLGRFWLQTYAPSMPYWCQRLLEPKGDIPYGVAIAAGALWAYPYSGVVQVFALV